VVGAVGVADEALGSAPPGARGNGEPAIPVLVLENSAGSGAGMGASIEELAMILDALGGGVRGMDRIAFCLDTAHLWGYGYRIDEAEALDAVLARFDTLLGLERLAMVHLNDSRSAAASRLDRHEHIGAGRIGIAGMRNVLRHPRLAEVPVFLETPGMDEGYDAVNLDRVRHLLRGEALPTLPPEAFMLHRGRASVAPPEAAAAAAR
jgi:deoxyribonuclease IV